MIDGPVRTLKDESCATEDSQSEEGFKFFFESGLKFACATREPVRAEGNPSQLTSENLTAWPNQRSLFLTSCADVHVRCGYTISEPHVSDTAGAVIVIFLLLLVLVTSSNRRAESNAQSPSRHCPLNAPKFHPETRGRIEGGIM